MAKLVILVEQELEVAAPLEPEVLEDAIGTIKDPEPYIDDEPCEINFRAVVVTADVTIDSGILRVHRALTFSFEFNDVEAFVEWVLDECMSEVKDKSNPNEVLYSVYADMLCTRIVCDYEGSFIDDTMKDYTNSYSLEYAG